MNANPEEAAQVATEYFSSLENLPHEAQFILEEIKYRDIKTEELGKEIHKQTQSYFRHSAARRTLPHKDAAVPDAVRRLYADIDALAAEKIALSERLVRIIERTMVRLQHGLQKTHTLQGEEPALPPTRQFLESVESMVQQIKSLRAAAQAIDVPATAPSTQDVPAPPVQKKRKTASTAGSTKLPSPVPESMGGYSKNSSAQEDSGLSEVVHPRRSSTRSRDFAHEKPIAPSSKRVEGKKDEGTASQNGSEGDEDAMEDDSLYCYCQKMSWGEMIGCDNKDCPYQWFHLSCVHLKPPLPDKWYCDVCARNLGLQYTSTSAVANGKCGRKGRKKL